jgi:protoporphyrinogen oxidase
MLSERGADVEIWEAGDKPGGILSPVDFRGMDVDRGSHRVHPDSHPLLRELTAEEQWEEQTRHGRLILGGRHIPYPIDPISFLRGLGLKTALRMGIGWLTRPGGFRRFISWEDDRAEAAEDDRGFENFVVERVGEAAYRRFYRPYVEKVWGEDPNDISQSVAKQRVSSSDPWTILLKSLGFGTETFLYPTRGMAGLCEHLTHRATDSGATIRYERRFDQSTLRQSNGDIPGNFDQVVYTGNLSELTPDAGLEHRGLYLLHLAVPSDAIDDQIDTWYVPESDFWFGRVSQPANFSSRFQRPNESVLCVEIPEGRWGEGEDFASRADEVVDQLSDADIVERDIDPSDVRQTFLPNVYPRYERGWFDKWEEALEEVRQMGSIWPVGRKGLFLHCNMDHCVSMASDAVDHVMRGESNDPWIDNCSQYLDLRVRD